MFGHIIHWQEADGDGTQTEFKWDILVMAGKPDAEKEQHRGNISATPSAVLTAWHSTIAVCCGFKPTYRLLR
ncbi:alkaline phosphatase PhoX [Neisseria weixii]|uniref:alkaline phosphatase PhoX n=1 Tax=Neisseria weixii TaxID=1853276 RepID=UPI001E49BA19